MTRIFVSHKKMDREWTVHLTRQLQAAGLEVFVDEDLESGEIWRQRIDRELQAADHLLLVASPEAVVSTEVRHELALFGQRKQNARGESRRVFVLLRAATPLPDAWNMGQHANAEVTETTYDREVRAIVRAIDSAVAVQLAPNLQNPHWGEAKRLPSYLRQPLVDLLTRYVANDEDGDRRAALKGRLGLGDRWDEHCPSPELVANAALAHWTEADHQPIEKAIALLEKLDKPLRRLAPEAVAELRSKLDAARQPTAVANAPLRSYFDFVLRETRTVVHERLRWHQDERDREFGTEGRELDRVFLALDVDRLAAKGGDAEAVRQQAAALAAAWDRDEAWGIGAPVSVWAAGAPGQLQAAMIELGRQRRCLVDRGLSHSSGFRLDVVHVPEELGHPDRLFHDVFVGAAGRLLHVVRVEAGASHMAAEFLERRLRELPRSRTLLLHEGPCFDLEGLLRLDLTLHPHLTGCFVLQGQPGSGKSTVLRHAARALARSQEAIPVLVVQPGTWVTLLSGHMGDTLHSQVDGAER